MSLVHYLKSETIQLIRVILSMTLVILLSVSRSIRIVKKL